MKPCSEEDLNIRAATQDDVPTIQSFIVELAEFEGAAGEIHCTEEKLKHILFVRRGAEALIVEIKGIPIGFAIWAYSFSTFTGKPTLYIDDLYVKEEYRSRGIGSAVFSYIAEIACENDCGRMDWYCMETNVSGKEYYHKMGAEEIDWFKVFRLNREQIEEMRRSQ